MTLHTLMDISTFVSCLNGSVMEIILYFQHRMNAEGMKEMLAQRASQFRAIQRRLLTRFKDKTPAPLQNLDTLMEGTYRQLLHLADSIEENNISMATASNALCCATNLFNYIVKLWTNMSDEEFGVLESSITPQVSDTQDQVRQIVLKVT